MIPFHDCKKWIKEGYRTRDAHLAEHFCKDERVGKVLVINRPTSLAEMTLKRVSWKTSTLEGVATVYTGKKFEISQLDNGIYCLDIKLPDFLKVARERKQWWYSAFQNEFVLKTIDKSIEYLGLKDCVLLLQNPMAVGVVGKINYKCFAFDAIDNWLYHPQMKSNHTAVIQNYQIIEKKADIIFTVSKALTETFKNNRNVHWISNGVDIDFFEKAIKKRKEGDLLKIGYVGKIQDRVDFGLVEKCLQKYPKIKFIFIGPVYSQELVIKELGKKYQNISFMGDVHYSKLPGTMKELDIAIIPHYVDKFTESMNPLKLYEYLAAGKPVVTTGVAGTIGISKFVFSGNDDAFIDQLDRVISMVTKCQIDSNEVVNSIPEEYFWNHKSGEILECMKKSLAVLEDA